MAETYGAAVDMGSDALRVTAPNPSPMTATGTQTYVLGAGRGRAVVDPGPDDADHRAAVLAAVGGARVEAILVTHAHLDHSAGAAALSAATGAPIHGWPTTRGRREARAGGLADHGGGEGVDAGFVPDFQPEDGAVIAGEGWSVRAIWTPGHMASHLAYEWRGAVLTGDAVMGWASTMISPPDGDLGQFLATCARLGTRAGVPAWPGHGDAVPDLGARAQALAAHRMARTAAILAALAGGAGDLRAIVAAVYPGLDAALAHAAGRNVLAHLLHLAEAGEVVLSGAGNSVAAVPVAGQRGGD